MDADDALREAVDMAMLEGLAQIYQDLEPEQRARIRRRVEADLEATLADHAGWQPEPPAFTLDDLRQILRRFNRLPPH